VINNKEYDKWLNNSQLQEGRSWFYWLTFYVDLYCWLLIAGNALGIFIAHLIPIMHLIDPEHVDSWNSCVLLSDSSHLVIPCVIVFHVMEGTCVISVVAICIYILRKWDFAQLDLFEKLIGLTNILTIALFLFEGVVTWITFIRDSVWYQSWPLFGLLWVILAGILLGWFIQYQVFAYRRLASNFTIKYPKTEQEIVSYVREAYVDRAKIRVIGSKHSAPASIYVDHLFSDTEVMLSLDKYTGVRVYELEDEESKEAGAGVTHRAVVKGGTCLGLNRDNPLSSTDNGLVYILQHKYGLSLPDTGGVVMQTAAGFTAMGCAGGTLYHDYYQCVHSLRIVDGRGNIQVFYRPTYEQDPEYKHPYWGVVVSMGLMGVISEITYDLRKTYNVLGSQLLWPVRSVAGAKCPVSWEDAACVPDKQDGDGTGPLDLFADNSAPNSLYNFFVDPENKFKTEYARIFAWPQVDPNLVTVWKGHRERRAEDAQLKEWSACYQKPGKFTPQFYHEVGDPETGKGGVAEQKILSFFYNFFDHFTNIQTMQLPAWAVKIIQFMIVKGNPTADKKGGALYFGAPWCDILPMDQEMWTRLMPIQFTELWFDIKDTGAVMQCLKEYWAHNEGLQHTGTFSWEFYPARAGGHADVEKGETPGGAWVRPAYGRQSFRVDVLWFDVKTALPYHFFTPLWNKFIEKGLYFRPHWAKYYPGGNVAFPGKEYKMWRDYYAAQYPKWNAWRELREKMDPQNIFVSTYWADTFDIQQKTHVVEHKGGDVENAKTAIEMGNTLKTDDG